MKYSKELHERVLQRIRDQGEVISFGTPFVECLLGEISRLQAENKQYQNIFDIQKMTIERLQAERRWIPVSERLPEEENKSRLVYGDFFDKAVIALGFSSAMLPGTEAETKMLKRISDLFWLVRNLSDALDCVYGKLPAHWRELPFSYHELKRKVKEIMKNG